MKAYAGRQRRGQRIGFDEAQFLVPMDHGITMGPIDGLWEPQRMAREVTRNGADGVIVHRGLAPEMASLAPDTGLVLHLNGQSEQGGSPARKTPVASVQDALAVDADAVSVHVNVGSGSGAEPKQLEFLGEVVTEAGKYGLPVLAMAYPSEPPLKNYDRPSIAHAVRFAAEAGADMIKCPVPEDPTSMEVVNEATRRPVLIAGGEPDDLDTTLRTVADATAAPGVGVCMGRTIFQDDDPAAMAAAVSAIVHHEASYGEAIDVYREQADDPNAPSPSE